MFGKTLDGSVCDCGCSRFIQMRRMICLVEGVSGVLPVCGDQTNARTWAAANYPTGCDFVANPSAWNYLHSVQFDSPTATTPNPLYTQVCGVGALYPNNGAVWPAQSASYIDTNPGGQSYVSPVSVLLPYSTAYLTGEWCTNGHSTAYHQKSCIATGVPTSLGFVYELPIPLIQICEDVTCDDTDAPNNANYFIFSPAGTAGDPGMYPFGGDWSDVLADIAANPTLYQPGFDSPPPCLSSDPFYGSSPP